MSSHLTDTLIGFCKLKWHPLWRCAKRQPRAGPLRSHSPSGRPSRALQEWHGASLPTAAGLSVCCLFHDGTLPLTLKTARIFSKVGFQHPGMHGSVGSVQNRRKQKPAQQGPGSGLPAMCPRLANPQPPSPGHFLVWNLEAFLVHYQEQNRARVVPGCWWQAARPSSLCPGHSLPVTAGTRSPPPGTRWLLTGVNIF